MRRDNSSRQPTDDDTRVPGRGRSLVAWNVGACTVMAPVPSNPVAVTGTPNCGEAVDGPFAGEVGASEIGPHAARPTTTTPVACPNGALGGDPRWVHSPNLIKVVAAK